MEQNIPEWRLRSRGEGLGFRRKRATLGLYADCIIEQGVRILNEEYVEIGPCTYIGHEALIHGDPRNLITIGNRCWIGFKTMIFGQGGLTIEDDVGIGSGVVIMTSAHQVHSGLGPIIHRAQDFAPVHIKAGADIGSNSIVMPGIVVGACAQIGAGAVVTHDVFDYEIWAGVPAKKIGEVANVDG